MLGVLCVTILGGLATSFAADEPQRLVSRKRPVDPAAKTVAVGDKITTAAGERRRLILPDRSVVYLRERSTLTVRADDRVTLSKGEAFFETASGKRATALLVETPKREVQARDSRFGVRVEDAGTTVIVASGQARVEGVEAAIRAGQALEPTAKSPKPAPRISHLVTWTRDLRQAAPLVPASEHAGGSLIARDPDGQEARLELRRYKIDVHFEDGFARTTIDQVYFNHTQDRLEGTFRFPLPADASLSRLAMFVDGKLMEGGMAERDHARAVYERIVWEKRDPALLEWVDGTTFKMRVFPLEPRQEKRLLLSYTQRLPVLYGAASYRFPAGHSLAEVGEWSLHVRVKGGGNMGWQSESHALSATKEGGDLLLDATKKNARLDRDVVLQLNENLGKGDEVRFSSAELDGQKYLMVRYRPVLEGAAQPERRDWVVLVETSGDRDPLLARTQIELVRSLLENAGRDDTFTLVTASTRTRRVQEKPVINDAVAIAESMVELENAHLVGAFDFGRALNDIRPLLEGVKAPYLLHVGSGIAAMGEARTDELIKRIPKRTRYVGVGVGKRWNRAFMQAAAERSGGCYTQVNPDEPAAWRGMEIAMTLATPRLLDAQVSDRDGKVNFLPFVRMIGQGEELAAVARVTGEMPEAIRITGKLDGKEMVREFEIRDLHAGAGYLPRSWAKREIDRLLAEDPVKHKDAIIALSKAMYVMTPYTSLLVLENDDMYTQFKVDRGRKDHWALYPAPAKIPVVVEPVEGDAGDPRKGIEPSAKVVSQSIRVRQVPHVLKVAENVFRDNKRLEYYRPSLALVVRTRSESVVNELQLGQDSYLGAPDPVSLDRLPRYNPTSGHPTDEPSSFVQGVQVARPILASAANGVPYEMPILSKVPVITRLAALNDAESRSGELFHDGGDRGGNGLGDYSAVLRTVRDGATGTLMFGGIGVNTDGGFTGSLGVGRSRGTGPYDLVPEILGRTSPVHGPRASLLYFRPSYSSDDRLFYDLLAYAPGLNASAADVRAVIEAEARASASARRGSVSTTAKALVARARGTGWRSLAIPANQLAPAYCISFDGTGQYTWERTLSNGLRERVICDGTTLWHLYPELGLGAKRAVTRFHRLAMTQALPWVLPEPEDLTRGADMASIDEGTVAIIPHGVRDAKGKDVPHVQMHLAFANGRLTERRLVEMPEKKVLRREVISDKGTFKYLDGDGKEFYTFEGTITEDSEPALKADVKKLVVLDLPFRTPAHVLRVLKIEKKPHADLTFDEARQLLTSYVGSGDAAQARQVFEQALARREQRQIGYYVLLAAAGVNLDSDNVDVLDAHPHEPLAHYLSLHSSPVLRKHASRWAAASNTWGDGLLRRLTLGHALCQRWSSGKSLGVSAAQRNSERQRALAYVKQYRGTALAWALLGLVQDRTAEEKEKDIARAAYGELATAYGQFTDAPGLNGFARYEQARCLAAAGQKEEARKQFLALYEEQAKQGVLLAIDGDFRAALLGDEKDSWTELMRRTATTLVEKKNRFAVLLLARQCWQLDDRALSQHLFGVAMQGVSVKGDKDLALQSAALGFLVDSEQSAAADRLVSKVLEDGDNAKRPELWRLAARLARQRENPARALECAEKALELDFANLPEIVNLKRVREEYGELLEQYDALARAMATLKLKVPAGFRERVVRSADRWRALDRDQEKAARAAAAVLRTLGERELAWDYLTTPVALRPGESDVWVDLATTLQRQGDRDLADRAYRAAFERESTNAQLLWDRADNLKEAGRLVQAKALYRQIADCEWQPRFAMLKTQARWLLEGR
jgi:tetratricopeptide (TPR) repeat protein